MVYPGSRQLPAILLLGAVMFFTCSVTGLADDSAPARAATDASGFKLMPGSEIVLTPGEQTSLTVFDTAADKSIQAAKLSWTINGQPIDQAGPGAGSLQIPQKDPAATNTVYIAPSQVPAKSTMQLKAVVSASGASVALTARITILSDPNWFAVEGDAPAGNPLFVPIRLDPKLSSRAGPYDGRSKLMKGEYFVWVLGTDKGNANTRVKAVLGLGKMSNGQKGTFSRTSGPDTCGVEVDYLNTICFDWTIKGTKPATLGGYTALLETDPKDSSGLVRGFYAGNLVWMELLHLSREVKPHYVTIRGHFAVPEAK